MFLPHTIGNHGKSATKRRGRVPRRTGAGEKPDSGSIPPTSETVGVHIDAGSEILREIKQYREVFEAIVCSNGWDDVTAALQLLSHLDGDALNVALLVPESRRVKPGFFIESLSEHYNAPGHLAEYKRQLQRAVRHPGDDPSIFAMELQTLARRALMDINLKIQSQMVRDRFIDGQAECALRRHLDSLGPNTPIPDIVDCCRIWERHCEVEIQPQTGAGRRPVCVIGQVTEVEPTPAMTP